MRPQLTSLLNKYSPVRAIIRYVDIQPHPHLHPNFELPPDVVLELPINDIWFTSFPDQCPLKHKVYN